MRHSCPTCRFEGQLETAFHVLFVQWNGEEFVSCCICPKCNHEVIPEPVKPKKPSTLRRSRLKPMSDKRKALMKVVGPERKARKAEVGRCMVCRREFPPEQLEGDEIARGAAREQCLSVPELTLISCAKCHRLTQDWPPAKRIALLVAFEIDFKCAKFCELRGYAITHLTRNSVVNYLDYSKDVNDTSPESKKAKELKR